MLLTSILLVLHISLILSGLWMFSNCGYISLCRPNIVYIVYIYILLIFVRKVFSYCFIYCASECTFYKIQFFVKIMTKYMSLAVFDTESWLFSLLKNSLAISQVWITIVNVSHSVKEQQRFMKNNVLALVQRSTQAHEFLWSISAEDNHWSLWHRRNAYE